MFKVLFTSDYEIHGSGMGSPHELIVDPTTRMLDQLDRYGAKLTIMADTGELLKFKEYAEKTGDDRFAWTGIEAQLERAVRTGHDAQLHIHSSYVNATWDEAKGYWRQDWTEYDLASLSYDRLRELIRRGKELLEGVCRRAKPDYECFAFRAANWSMHPSPNIVRALVDEGFRIDTSVWKYGRYDDLVKFDYTSAHDALVPWPVDARDVCRRDPEGRLFEFPIYTEQKPIWVFLTPNRVYRVVAQRLNPLPAAEPKSGAAKKRSILGKAKMLVTQHAWKMDFNQCTGRQLIEGLKRVEEKYGHRDVPLPFVLIGHSKTFTRHNERSLRPFLEFVADRPDRFSWGTFADFDPERYRALAA
jgi:peptidoglycan/xylan/chitin deacetylase (PgdA/CDA1 family)